MNKQQILDNLDIADFYQTLVPSLKLNGKPEVMGLCVFHDDNTPSLSVNTETGLFHCFACDAKGDVFTFYQRAKGVDFPTALKEMGAAIGIVKPDVGLKVEDKKVNGKLVGTVGTDKPNKKPKVVATFKYRNEQNEVIYVKKRREPGKDGRSKDFLFEHKENGKWVYSRGYEAVLYCLPELIKAKACFIVEGEAKADLLNSWELVTEKFVATCFDSGAKSLWRSEYLGAFEGKELVVILPDNDKSGWAYASKIANALSGKVKELKVVELPGLQAGEDIIDWANVPGNNRTKLLEIVGSVPLWTPKEYDKPEAILADVKEKETETQGDFHCSDLGNAQRLVAQHGDKIRYCFAWKKRLAWDGKTWHIDNNGQILRLAKDTVRKIYAEAAAIADKKQRERVATWAISSESEHRLNAMVALAQSEPSIPVLPDHLDVNPYLLNCLNGTINSRTGQLKPHDPKDFITKTIPVEYNPNATCPRWIEFLETIFNWNYDIIPYLQRAIGYSLTGDVSEQCLFLLHGTGCNGKSTLLNCLSMLLGDYSQTADFETFLVKKNEGVRNDLARMIGKRFIFAVEAEGERRLAEVLVKQLTGGDTITARFLFSEYFDFKPTFKTWLAANHKPHIRGTDYAIWRRIRLIPFNVTIAEDKKDIKFLGRLTAEMPGILAWAVQGCLEWQKNGLQTPDEVKTATNSYRDEMDVIGAFLSECCILTSEVKTKASDLFESYKKWCESTGEYVLTQRIFGLRLAEHGLEKVKSGGNYWKGVGIKQT